MIPTLLWQCPLCHVDDALRHEPHWFRHDEVWCRQCGTVWEVRRVIGDDYLLTVTHGILAAVGQQRPLAEWYDLMKAGIRLAAKQTSTHRLEAAEEVYLQSQQAELLAEEDNPLFVRWNEEEAPWRKNTDIGLSFMKRWDKGRLLLTSERLLWEGSRQRLTFRLRKLNSMHTEVTWYLGLLYGLYRYKFRFREESILKWLTYTASVAGRIEEVHQHRIAFSNF
jgi:hypothetical protein